MPESPEPGPIDVALTMDQNLYTRMWEAVRHLCVGLVDQNVRVRLLSSWAGAEELTLGPIQTVVHQELTWPFRRQRLRPLIDALAVRKPTVIHALCADTYWSGAQLAAAFDIDLVLYVTGMKDLIGLEQLEAHRVSHVVAASAPLLDAVRQTERIDADAQSLIRPGMLRSDGATCFLNAGQMVSMLCTSDLTDSSGVDQLLRAVRILRDRDRDLLLFLSGSGPKERQLRRLVRELGISSCVTFARPRADASQVMAGADISVQPAPETALSAASLLAMATGTAVVCCAGGMIDHCLDGQTAVVCADNQPAALADGIERLLADPEGARSMALAGIEHIKKYHGVSAMAQQLTQLYERLGLRRRTFSLQEQNGGPSMQT
ncbi:MAG: glycosyltransferase family 4 protein [Phycisphaerae bacterium]